MPPCRVASIQSRTGMVISFFRPTRPGKRTWLNVCIKFYLAPRETPAMGKRSLIMVTLAALFAAVLPTLSAPAEEKIESKTIARWIKQMGNNNFGDREEATRALIRIGPAARDQLEIAAAGKDAEV